MDDIDNQIDIPSSKFSPELYLTSCTPFNLTGTRTQIDPRPYTLCGDMCVPGARNV